MSAFRATFDLANNTVLTPANCGYTTMTGERTAVADTAIKHVGTASAKVTGTGSTSWNNAFTNTPTSHYRRMYIYLDTLPSATTRIWDFRNGADTADVGDVGITTTGQVRIRNSSLVQTAITTTALATGQWYRLEIAMENGTCTLRLFAGSKLDSFVTDYTEEISGTYTAGTIGAVRAGGGTASTWNYHIDDEVGSDTGWVDTAIPPVVTPPATPLQIVGVFGSPAASSAAINQVQGTIPATAQAGDMAIVLASTNAPARSLTIPSGWTPLLTAPLTTPSYKRSYLLKRRLVSSDANTLVTTQWDGPSHISMVGIVVRGASAVIDNIIQSASAAPLNQNTFATPPWSAKVDNALAVCLISAAGVATGDVPVSFTPPANWTEDRDVSTTTSAVITGQAMHRQLTGGANAQQGGSSGTWSAPVTSYHQFIVTLAPMGTGPAPSNPNWRYKYHGGLWVPSTRTHPA